jgi:para-aminobenzoate synthetase component 1
LVERQRLHWRIEDGGDPAALVEEFLADAGLRVGAVGVGAARVGGARAGAARAGGVGVGGAPKAPPDAGACGACLYVSAAAGAYLAGAPTGAPSPVPAIPDVVAVVYGYDPVPQVVPDVNGPADAWTLGGWQDSWTAAEHAEAVRQVRAAIARGDVYQVNIVGHAAAPYLGDPMPALHRVATLSGARYGGVLTGGRWSARPAGGGRADGPVDAGRADGSMGAGRADGVRADGDWAGAGDGGWAGDGWAVACASPETLVSVSGGRVATRPIKGTRPATPAGRRELLASAKERAEHVMIVDLERNDLARIARTGSVRVDELYAVRRWCDLWQAESVVSAELADGVGLAELLRAVCPGGSVTGAPKLAALEQIADLEPVGRGASMGALGWVGPDWVELGLSIRTVAVDGERVHVWAGGGITWGSDPDAEVAEAAAKAAPLRAALNPPPIAR